MISPTTLKRDYMIDDNIDDKYLIPVIKKCQDLVVNPILGNTKYNQLLNDIDNNTLNAEDSNLLKDYIQDILAYYVMSEVVFSTAYKLKNNPEYQQNPNAERFDELIRISKKYRIDSQAYEQRLRDYICRKGIILPTTDGAVKKSGYKTGLFIG